MPIERPTFAIAGPHFSPGAASFGGASAGGSEGPHVKIPKGWNNPAILSHELGHADIHKNMLGRLVQNPVTTGAASLAPALAGVGGFASGFSDDERVRRGAVLAPLAMSAPTLAYEAGASLLGARKLRRAGASGKQMLNAAKALVPAWGTYAARAGTSTASAAGSQAIGTAVHNHLKKEQEKNAFSASAYSTPIEGAKPNRMVSEGPQRSAPLVNFPLQKVSFSVSQYSGPLSMGPFRMASGLPPFRAPSLQAGFERKQDALQMSKSSGAMAQNGLSPAGMLASGQGVGKPKITNPSGPSLGDLSKPIGFGSKIPGAAKGTL